LDLQERITMLNGFFCWAIELAYNLPQRFLNDVFGFFGLDAPEIPDFVGSIFGCNV
jgi:hypothetical protein